MKLMLYEKFFDNFIELKKSTQKKVIEFQRKFRDNSKSAAIHLEPISTFKDKSLRTARIDKTYRAILKAPESGDVYYLLWVDHHDKAYAWAENKVFQWNKNTQAMQMFEQGEEIKNIEKQKDYQVDHSAFSDYTDDDLLRIGVPEVLLSSVNAIQNMDDLEDIQQFIPEDAFENLFYLMDGASISALITEVEEGKVDSDRNEEIDSKNNQRSFIELTDDTIFNEVLNGDFEKWKYYLHPSQRAIVNKTYNGATKITGGAGTGKTVAAIHRLKYLTDKYPNAKILFTTFTKALTINLENLISGFNVDANNTTIINIHKLAYQLAVEFSIIDDDIKVIDFQYNSDTKVKGIFETILDDKLSEFSVDFYMQEWKNVILYHNIATYKDYVSASRKGRSKPIGRRQKKEIWEVFVKYKSDLAGKKYMHRDQITNMVTEFLESQDKHIYDHIIVDELQDFSNVELRLVRALVKDQPDDLFLVGDPLQKVYDSIINFSQAGINVRGRRSKRLRINYRTSEEIKKLALSIIKNISFEDFDGGEESKAGYISVFRGKEPEIVGFKSKDEELDYIVNHISTLINSDKQIELSDIAICTRTNNSLKEIKKILHNKDIKYNESNGDILLGHQNGIQLLTMHSIKGLEFKHVIISDLGSLSFPLKGGFYEEMSEVDQENHLKREKSLLYVATSRARESVLLSGVGELAL